MPICMRAELNKTLEPPDIRDDEVVFFCQPTGEIFRDYEEYIDRIMLVNSTIWACGVTGTKNLTYIEAMESEKVARKKLTKHMDKLKAPILLLIEQSKQTQMRDLCDLLYQFLKNRYFVGETVCITKTVRPFKILEIIKPPTEPENGVYDPSSIRYKIQNMKREADIYIEDPARLKRRKTQFSYEILKYFVKEYTILVDNFIRAKEDLYRSVIIDKKITFESIFIGKMPHYEPGKIMSHKKAQINGKQMSLESYLVKNKTDSGQKTTKNLLPKGKALAEEMERIRLEKLRKQEELDKIRAERLLKIEKEVTNILTKRDDLEREDQKLMPVYTPVKTLIPCKFFGDILMIQEFLNSFLPHLAAYDVFKGARVTFPIMCRAYNVKEVAGPLGDMLQVLLSSIFSLQIEEEQECKVEYVESRQGDDEPSKSSSNASKAHKFVKTYFSHKIHDLPIDVQTLSEVLRLHLLSSGAPTDERSERWRYQYRNGYNKFEDPGLLLRLNYPHILRALKLYTIYQLPFSDVLKVLQCLIDQILTYSGTVALIEERHEMAAKARFDLRLLISAENKRVNSVNESQKQARIEYNLALMECKDNEEQKNALEKELERKLERITHQNEIDKNKFNAELEKIKSIIFDHMIYIGSDRAYRNYYILESVEGVFIEHPPESGDVCLSNPPINSHELAECTHERRALRSFMSTHMKMTDKENLANNTVSLKEKNELKTVQVKKEEILENGDVKKINGVAAPLKNGIVKTNPSQYELFMCTGDPQNCIVHDSRNKDRVRWSYLYKEEDFNALINSLNPFGIRESELKEKLVNLKALIFEHIKNCPADMLTLGDEPDAHEKAMEFVMNETQKKYNKTNFGLSVDTDLNEVMFSTLVEQILQLEEDVRSGNLGKLNVEDVEKWRDDVKLGTYESPVDDLSFGFEEKIDFRDPGEDLGDTLNIESEDSSDESVSPYNSPNLRKRIVNLSIALLQIAQGIDKKFLQEPFGRKQKRKKEDKKEVEKFQIQFERNFKHWEISLMNCSSFSQVFLHLNILHDAIMWHKSSNRSRCIVCKKGTDAEKMLLCDECNAGTHMYCMKPKLKVVPEGNWYCKKCKQDEPKKKSPVKKKVFSMDDDANDALPDENSKEEESSNDGRRKLRAKNVKQTSITEFIGFGTDDESSESSDESESSDDVKEEENGSACQAEDASIAEEDVCKECGFGDAEVTCMHCKAAAHLDCVGLRRFPRSGWICSEKCKPKETQKRRVRERLSSSSDDDEPLVKKQRRMVKAKTEATEDVNKNNTSRRSRRNYDCPLDSVILYDLLDEISKHQDSWPFLRPVSLFEVPDYHEIIKRPMDFARVKSNLNIGVYKSNEEFLQDVQLIFSNCDAYNAVGNDVYQAGVSLEKYIAKRCEELNLPFTKSDMIAESEVKDEVEDEVKSEGEES